MSGKGRPTSPMLITLKATACLGPLYAPTLFLQVTPILRFFLINGGTESEKLKQALGTESVLL